MTNKKSHLYVEVFLPKIGFTKAGQLIIDEINENSTFIYDNDYIINGYPSLNPATLNWKHQKTKNFVCTIKDNKHMLDKTFWELIPNESDWATQVLVSRFPEYQYMNNSQKISFLGNHIVGGMRVSSTETPTEQNINNIDYLDKIRDESVLFHQKYLKNIKYYGAIKPLTSYGGIRPKCMYEENGEFWIVKFNLPDDIYDMALNEKVALDMARDMGLNVAESKVVQMPSGENVFFSKRFDREKDERFYTLSLFSLIPFNTKANSTGKVVYKLIQEYSDFANRDTVNIITKLLLDIGINNTDNHLKNLRIILNNQYKWELAPLYDITFNPYEQDHTYLPIEMSTKDLYLENNDIIKNMSDMLGIKPSIIEEQREKVVEVLYKWEEYCDKYNMKNDDKEQIAKSISIGLNKSSNKLKVKHNVSNDLTHKIPLPKLRPF